MADLQKTSILNNIVTKQESALERKAGMVFFASLCLAVLGTLCGVFAFWFSYEPEIGYFERGAVLPVLFTVILLCNGALALGTIWLFRKDTMAKEFPRTGSRLYFVGIFACFMSVFEAIFRVITMMQTEDFFQNLFSEKTNRIEKLSGVIDLLSVVFALLTAVSFYFLVSDKASRKKKMAFGMLPCIRCLIGILQVFFDTTLAINLPIKLIGEFALMSAVLFYLAEERLRISAYYARPALYVAGSIFAMGMCGAGGISLLFFYFKYRNVFSTLNGGAHYGQICLEAVFCILTFLYLLFRFGSYVKAIEAPAAEEAAEEAPAEEGGEAEEPAEDHPQDEN